MTDIARPCVAIACPYAPRISGLTPDKARVSGTPGLRFRTIADVFVPGWHSWNDTANAVRW